MPLSKNEIKFIRSLQQKKFREEEVLFIVEGTKLVDELLAHKSDHVHQIFHLTEWSDSRTSNLDCFVVSSAELSRISGLKSPNQVLAVVKKFEDRVPNYETIGLTLILDTINDPGNLGTIIRTADWFGVKQIICSENSVEIYNSKVVQASMGSIFRTPVHYGNLTSALKLFEQKNIPIYGAEMIGNNVFEQKLEHPAVLLMGSESHGISQNLQGLYYPVTIPKFGESESLNVGMAAGIIMAEWVKQN